MFLIEKNKQTPQLQPNLLLAPQVLGLQFLFHARSITKLEKNILIVWRNDFKQKLTDQEKKVRNLLIWQQQEKHAIMVQ